MKVSKEKMAENRARILGVAADLFRERGFQDVTVAEIMSAAGMTHGAFPSHFKSKDNLIACTLEAASQDLAADRFDRLSDYAAEYLSKQHREDVAQGCVFSALASEAARSTPESRHALTAGLERHLDALAAKAPGSDPEARRQEAVTTWATLVGALILSRVVDDEALADEILDRAKAGLAR